MADNDKPMPPSQRPPPLKPPEPSRGQAPNRPSTASQGKAARPDYQTILLAYTDALIDAKRGDPQAAQVADHLWRMIRPQDQHRLQKPQRSDDRSPPTPTVPNRPPPTSPTEPPFEMGLQEDDHLPRMTKRQMRNLNQSTRGQKDDSGSSGQSSPPPPPAPPPSMPTSTSIDKLPIPLPVHLIEPLPLPVSIVASIPLQVVMPPPTSGGAGAGGRATTDKDAAANLPSKRDLFSGLLNSTVAAVRNQYAGPIVHGLHSGGRTAKSLGQAAAQKSKKLMSASKRAQQLSNRAKFAKNSGRASRLAKTAGQAAKMAGTLATFAKVLPVVGTVVAGFALVGEAAVKLTQVFLERAHELARYSGQIAAAEAQANVKNTRADIHEAQVLGPDLARLVTASNDIMLEIRDFLLPFKAVLVDILATGAEGVSEILAIYNFLFNFGKTARADPDILRAMMRDAKVWLPVVEADDPPRFTDPLNVPILSGL